MNSNELFHHGIMGMKWGIRRYQYEDGTLTPEGEERYRKVSSSDRRKNRDTIDAKRVLKKTIRAHSQIANSVSKFVEKHPERKDQEEALKAHRLAAENASKKLSEIESGKLQAGRDFIVQRDYNAIVIPLLGVAVNRTDTIIERKSGKR